ncbi:MAG: DUF421 domain-containing protein [Eubacteriales bacterium]|nr:DUF421 domain-containing protein [Eubacteriales bacterium]MDD3199500.1 DUF421 domain-containing protein [Eubacteriales bacterium]MDD4121971.1 DUF421 domain-containing protein [Eubacteriales bacterium]MDD4630601.1 DUF421 domain-containing protein [Eubacteriales bacterium]
MLIIVIRTMILYFTVLFVMRVMGKAELSKLDPFEIIILFMIAELAAIPIESIDVPIFSGIAAIITLLLLEVLLSFLSTKSGRIDAFLKGKPSILIHRGNINKQELKNQRMTINDLMEQLRIKNYPSAADVDYAVLEANGELSVIPKPEKAPLTREDMNIPVSSEIMPMVLISDGNLYKRNLALLGKDESYLKKELSKIKITDYSQVFLCFFDEKRKLHIYPKEKCKNGMQREVGI